MSALNGTDASFQRGGLRRMVAMATLVAQTKQAGSRKGSTVTQEYRPAVEAKPRQANPARPPPPLTLIMVDDDRLPPEKGEQPRIRSIRFRTLGCYPLTGAIESRAATLGAIIRETAESRISERSSRVIDQDGAVAM